MTSSASTYTGPLNSNGIPDFEKLPLRKEDPPLSAWGLYGPDDELGTLNRLTGERVVEAVKEVKTGVRISLNWPLNAQTKSGKAFFGRQLFHQDLIHKAPRIVNDDEWSFNSQVSSQWDGLRHFAYQKEEKFYNGVTLEDIHGKGFVKPAAGEKKWTTTRDGSSSILGIQAMAKAGIVGRAILLDYHSWRLSQSPIPTYDSFATSPIPLSQLLACASSQGTEIKFGDLLLIRSGYFASLQEKSDHEIEQLKAVNPPSFGGVAQSTEILKWLWQNFSAVAGDQPSFECWPPQTSSSYLHDTLLAGWGMPIGEIFDLETLAEHCKREGRWSFFFTSEVCNVVGGVASPPNCLAIF